MKCPHILLFMLSLQLFWIDANAQSIELLDDFNTLKYGSEVELMVAQHDKIYFNRWTQDAGWLLHVTDGTEDGTRYLWPDRPDSAGINAKHLIACGNTIIFDGENSESTGANNQRILYSYDGSELVDLGHFDDIDNIWTDSKRAIVQTRALSPSQRSVLITDGTTSGTTELFSDINGLRGPPVFHNGDIYYVALDDNIFAFGLFQIDSNGTSHSLNQRTTNLYSSGGRVYFETGISDKLYEVIGSDIEYLGEDITRPFELQSQLYAFKGQFGDSISIVKIPDDGSRYGSFSYVNSRPITINDKLIFPALSRTVGFELWGFDPVKEEVNLLVEIPGIDGSNPHALIEFAGKAHFMTAPKHGKQTLWRTDGTKANTQPYPSFTDNGLNNPLSLIASDSAHLVMASYNQHTGRELWILDSNSLAPRLLMDINPGPAHAVTFGSRNLLKGSDLYSAMLIGPSNAPELWHLDLTSSTATQLTDQPQQRTYGLNGFIWRFQGNKFVMSGIVNGLPITRALMQYDMENGNLTQLPVPNNSSVRLVSNDIAYYTRQYFIRYNNLNNQADTLEYLSPNYIARTDVNDHFAYAYSRGGYVLRYAHDSVIPDTIWLTQEARDVSIVSVHAVDQDVFLDGRGSDNNDYVMGKIGDSLALLKDLGPLYGVASDGQDIILSTKHTLLKWQSGSTWDTLVSSSDFLSYFLLKDRILSYYRSEMEGDFQSTDSLMFYNLDDGTLISTDLPQNGRLISARMRDTLFLSEGKQMVALNLSTGTTEVVVTTSEISYIIATDTYGCAVSGSGNVFDCINEDTLITIDLADYGLNAFARARARNDEIYISAANAKYGAELWKLTFDPLAVSTINPLDIVHGIIPYPNPTRGEFQISLGEGNESMTHISIFDIAGRSVAFNYEVANDILRVSILEEDFHGMLFILLETNTGLFSGKVVMQK